jgi:hypothetical protein
VTGLSRERVIQSVRLALLVLDLQEPTVAGARSFQIRPSCRECGLHHETADGATSRTQGVKKP